MAGSVIVRVETLRVSNPNHEQAAGEAAVLKNKRRPDDDDREGAHSER